MKLFVALKQIQNSCFWLPSGFRKTLNSPKRGFRETCENHEPI
jgi:hypothetical protein